MCAAVAGSLDRNSSVPLKHHPAFKYHSCGETNCARSRRRTPAAPLLVRPAAAACSGGFCNINKAQDFLNCRRGRS
jgi:hypothetical protein